GPGHVHLRPRGRARRGRVRLVRRALRVRMGVPPPPGPAAVRLRRRGPRGQEAGPGRHRGRTRPLTGAAHGPPRPELERHVSLGQGQLGAFGQLAKALGILDAAGSPNAQWFTDPVGGGSSHHGLRHLLSDDGQREALTDFVDSVLGPPDREQHGDEVWVPLFKKEDAPQLTISAVVRPVVGAVHLGIGLEVATNGLPAVASRIHVPIFQFARGAATLPGGGELPEWLLIGRPAGRVEVSVDATLRSGPPPPGQTGMAGMALTLGIPTAEGADLSIKVDLRDLRLPGASEPQTFTLDAERLADLDDQVFNLIVGLVRAQADALDTLDPALRPFASLAGMLGLRTVAGLPPLPLADLPSRGISALV